MISDAGNELSEDACWRTNVLEKSGTPLSILFRPTFFSEHGCALRDKCKICDNDGLDCGRRIVTYRLHMDCKDKEQVIDMDCDQEADTSYNLDLETVVVVPTYIGETSHSLRARAKEHWTNFRDLKENSSMMLDLMKKHSTIMTPPPYAQMQID